LEDALWNAGCEDPELLRARIAVCEEALRRFPVENELMVENRCRAVAESYFKLGEADKAEALFEQWLANHYPDRRDKVLNRIRSIRGGKLNDPRFGHRNTGEGVYAETITRLFERTANRLGLVGRRAQANEPCTTATFERPKALAVVRATSGVANGRAGLDERPLRHGISRRRPGPADRHPESGENGQTDRCHRRRHPGLRADAGAGHVLG